MSFYTEYLDSQDWKIRRHRLLKEAGRQCERCGHDGLPGMRHLDYRSLEVHHLTYERLGDERDEDLEVLCRECHRVADRERRRGDDLGPPGWRWFALRVYGRGWRNSYGLTEDDVLDEFRAWLE